MYDERWKVHVSDQSKLAGSQNDFSRSQVSLKRRQLGGKERFYRLTEMLGNAFTSLAQSEGSFNAVIGIAS
jgi:hypothetical protein